MPPIPKPEPWWPRNRGVVFAFVIYLGLVHGYYYLVDIYKRHARQQRFIPYLAAADPLRRQLGLLPLSPSFELAFHSTEATDSQDEALFKPKNTDGHSGIISKVLAVDSNNGQRLFEEDNFRFVAADTIKTAYGSQQAAMQLIRKYSFERARAKQPPWSIVVFTGAMKLRNPLNPRDSVDNALSAERIDSSYTYQQADSLIRLWRTRNLRPRTAYQSLPH